MSEQPTKPGYYWAKDADDAGADWEIVRVWPRVEGGFVCDAWGGSLVWELSDFTFGPEVTKPESLK